MGLFNNSVGLDDPDIAVKSNDGKIYKIVQLAAILALVVAAAVIIFEIFDVISLNSTVNGLIISVGVIGLGGMNVLPWVRIFERIKDKRFKITAIVFMAIIGVVVILWLICVWQVIALINSVIDAAESNAANLDPDKIAKDVVNSINTIRAALIVSLQFMIASGIATNIVKYRKSLIVYQAMSGVALLYLDFYFSLMLTAVTMTYDSASGVDFLISDTAEWLINPALGALLVLSLIMLAIVGTVFARTDKRRLIATANSGAEASGNKSGGSDNTTAENDSIEERLKKLQSLYDSGLINKDEFETRRNDILNNL